MPCSDSGPWPRGHKLHSSVGPNIQPDLIPPWRGIHGRVPRRPAPQTASVRMTRTPRAAEAKDAASCSRRVRTAIMGSLVPVQLTSRGARLDRSSKSVKEEGSVAKGKYLFTSEAVSMGHPDKLADQNSDGILD
ncbi:MAG: S-adenosylmethionine synthetase N-terminal domain-containing protein, partial [Thermoguttaceae bacterium]